MKKMLSCTVALALCLSLLLSAVPLQSAAASQGDGVITYRALLIGNTVYDAGSLHAPGYDVQHMEQLLIQQDFNGDKFDDSTNIYKLNNATKLQIINAIKDDLAAHADADDVTYFYYSGHGTFDPNDDEAVDRYLTEANLVHPAPKMAKPRISRAS